MSSLFVIIVSFLYASVEIVSTIAYLPTIRDLLKNKPSANITSYLLWTMTSGVSLLYGFVVLHDLLFIAVTSLGFVSCATVLILALLVRLRQKRKTENEKL